ncbi:DUF4038 domain-containing protein [Levilactobacillus fujinensis]|uniref:DUF4038 domain-containing protein n=2 Tax=Levilactobacillus fujinensis TaxID=2486024 RepID=A0ABW1TH63_9LACO
MRQYEMFELNYEASAPVKSEVDVNLTATFKINGHETKVYGFYAGNRQYKIRFYPRNIGEYSYTVQGIIKDSGEIDCKPADVSSHGMVRAKGTHFQTDDQKWFYPFGTTVYALAHQKEELIDQTFESLKDAPFNKIRTCVFPKHYQYNHNDPQWFPFKKHQNKWAVNHPNWPFWNHLDQIVEHLGKLDIQCDLILLHPYDCWGFSNLSKEQVLTYFNYVMRRYAAYPNIWWSLANEYDLLKYTKDDWLSFANYVSQHDPYHHLLSNHQMVIAWDFDNQETTHICVQIKDVDFISRDIVRYKKPMMVDECCYEGNLPDEWGNLSAFEMVDRFWKVCLQGGYCTHGETFLDPNDIIWWAKGGKLKGHSISRIAFLKRIIDQLPGPLTFAGEDFDEQSFHELQKKMSTGKDAVSPFVQFLCSLSWLDAQKLINTNRQFIGRCKDDQVIVQYYSRHCTAQGTIKLPADKKYAIDVIDVWKKTRRHVIDNVSGDVTVALPGKEGMAIIATQEAIEG